MANPGDRRSSRHTLVLGRVLYSHRRREIPLIALHPATASAARLASAQRISASRRRRSFPPISTRRDNLPPHSMEGVVMVSAFKRSPRRACRPWSGAGSFGIGQKRRVVRIRDARRRGAQATSMPCPPSPPSTFCQEGEATTSGGFDQGRSMARATEEASQIARPSRSSADPGAVGHTHARGSRAVPQENDVVLGIRLLQDRAARHDQL